MDRLVTTTLGSLVPNVFLLTMQDLAVAQRPSQSGLLTAMEGGVEARVWQATSDLSDGTLVQVDSTVINVVNTGVSPMALTGGTISWYDREILGVYRGFAGADQYPGGANDYQFDAAGAPTLFWGYTGLGGKNGASGQVTAGSAPVPAAGASWAIEITSNLWLYVDPYDNKLKLYNATGGAIRTPTLWFFASGATGAR